MYYRMLGYRLQVGANNIAGPVYVLQKSYNELNVSEFIFIQGCGKRSTLSNNIVGWSQNK